ncbi:MAG: peptidase [Gemmatimonadetes bacterium]|nr:peptidase [Gemmatimonadota bacterium]
MSPAVLAGLAFLFQFQAQSPDTAYQRAIREATSDPRFLPASTASVPASATIPSPLKYFGSIAGAPGVMHRSGELYGYFRALAAATPRVRVETVGRTEEGREIILVTVADEGTIRNLDAVKRATATLADPRGTTRADLDHLLSGAKPIYYLQGGLHSPEMGSPEMLTELAYRLAVSDDPAISAIRRNVVTIINPVSEPDGRDRQTEWYLRYTKGRPQFDDGFPRSSPYWGKYVFHDNNRDGLQLSQELTKAIYRVWRDWHPTVMHDLHESVPLIYMSTGTGPYNTTVDPITQTEWQTLANWDVQNLTQQGLPGAFTWAFYDGWWPGYALWVAINHNAIGRFYETFGNAGGDTYVRDLRNASYAGDSVTTAQWYRAWPASKKVRWSSRDNVNYQQAAVLASLDYTATHGREMLANFWQKGTNGINRGKTSAPHAFLIPGFEKQHDARRAAYLVNQLMRHGIEVHRTTDTLAGSFVVRLDQPYRDFAVSLLTKQDYPANAKYPPYDDIAWTLGLLYGVEVQPVNDTAVFHWRLEQVRDTVAYRVAVTGAAATGTWLVPYTGQAELLSALYALPAREPRAGAFAADTVFRAGDTTWGRGSIVIENLSRAGAEWLASEYGLPVSPGAPPPDVRRHRLDLPKLAVYHTWTSTQDNGWTRYWLDQLKVPYTSIDKDDLRAGRLRQRFDVILVPNAGGDAADWIHEVDPKWGPMPFTRTAQFASHGSPDSTADMTGGPGFAGVAELERFASEGGTIITLGNAGTIVVGTGIVRDLDPYQPSSLFHPGSVVRVKARRPNSPILYGYPETSHVFRGIFPLWRVPLRDRGLIVLQYGTELLADERDTVVADIMGMPKAVGGGTGAAGAVTSPAPPATEKSSEKPPYVLSGMVRNSDQIIGQGAIFDVPVGKAGAGRAIVFTFNPLHRFLNHHDAPMVFNAILNWNDR